MFAAAGTLLGGSNCNPHYTLSLLRANELRLSIPSGQPSELKGCTEYKQCVQTVCERGTSRRQLMLK